MAKSVKKKKIPPFSEIVRPS